MRPSKAQRVQRGGLAAANPSAAVETGADVGWYCWCATRRRRHAHRQGRDRPASRGPRDPARARVHSGRDPRRWRAEKIRAGDRAKTPAVSSWSGGGRRACLRHSPPIPDGFSRAGGTRPHADPARRSAMYKHGAKSNRKSSSTWAQPGAYGKPAVPSRPSTGP